MTLARLLLVRARNAHSGHPPPRLAEERRGLAAAANRETVVNPTQSIVSRLGDEGVESTPATVVIDAVTADPLGVDPEQND
jgi:hypothetical protein